MTLTTEQIRKTRQTLLKNTSSPKVNTSHLDSIMFILLEALSIAEETLEQEEITFEDAMTMKIALDLAPEMTKGQDDA